MGTPTNPVLTELRREGGYVVWDPSDGMLTREAVILLSGSGLCTAGLVLAAILTGTAAAAALGTNTGNGTFGAITVGGAAVPGDYIVEFDDATHFLVSAPGGQEIGHGTTGVAFSAGGLGFTITAGGTAFVAADSFKLTVTATAMKYVPFDPTATNGAQNPAAILWSSYRDATSADRRAVANVRGPMKVQAAELIWGANVTTTPQQTAALAQLAKLGILSI
ncbi:hypothetical protein FHS31_000830 [Sphingomonas vulcanisoli]|uniref:Head decoration protein n=1 Tax=Sphingomonas vulcanisoli TaxID=1658060 RepID=A0ABX0TSW9_9SPHN|nr:head decoration protein [Sphingomonas vulcanisoli]NIJ07234.1 hypothetical protein [Sphingomonas vulcanisoli]